jgi:hypothetical protein
VNDSPVDCTYVYALAAALSRYLDRLACLEKLREEQRVARRRKKEGWAQEAAA